MRSGCYVDEFVYGTTLGVMAETTTIWVDRSTREHLNRLARERHITVAQAASRAVRLLEQEQIGRDLAAPLTPHEMAWLDAEAGDVVELDLGLPRVPRPAWYALPWW